MPASELNALFSDTYVGSPVLVGNLALVPLLRDDDGPDADLLEESVGRGDTSVTEVSELGSVNLVRVDHAGPRLLLLIDGEQIVGAKQNRVFNASFLVPAGATADIPVSCVEQGRWRYRAAGFGVSRVTLVGRARAAKLSRVATGAASGSTGYDADQGAVWRDVDGYLERTRVTSPTAAYADGYRARAAGIEQQLATLGAPVSNQIGIAAVHGDRVVAMDVFGSAALFARAWKKIARGALADMYDKPTGEADASELVTQAMESLAGASLTRTPGPGCGQTLHAVAPAAVCGAVAYEGRVYHALVASP